MVKHSHGKRGTHPFGVRCKPVQIQIQRSISRPQFFLDSKAFSFINHRCFGLWFLPNQFKFHKIKFKGKVKAVLESEESIHGRVRKSCGFVLSSLVLCSTIANGKEGSNKSDGSKKKKRSGVCKVVISKPPIKNPIQVKKLIFQVRFSINFCIKSKVSIEAKGDRSGRALQFLFLRWKRARKRKRRFKEKGKSFGVSRLRDHGCRKADLKDGKQEKMVVLNSLLIKVLRWMWADGIREIIFMRFRSNWRATAAIVGDLSMRWCFLKFPLAQETKCRIGSVLRKMTDLNHCFSVLVMDEEGEVMLRRRVWVYGFEALFLAGRWSMLFLPFQSSCGQKLRCIRRH